MHTTHNITPDTTHVGVAPKVVVLMSVSLAVAVASTDDGTWLIVVVSKEVTAVPLSVVTRGTWNTSTDPTMSKGRERIED